MPFLHITTRITDHPYDGLLREKGFGGFPSLAFMDAEGEVVAQPRDRNVASFAATVEALGKLDAVQAKVDAGDEAAQVDLLLIEFELGRVAGEEFAERAAALREVATEAQRAQLDAIAIDEESWELIMQAFRGDRDEAMGKLLDMLNARRVPSAGSRSESYFWSLLGEHAQAQGDTDLLRRLARALEATKPTNEDLVKLVADLRETADSLAERDALAERAAAGEAGLEAKILLIELRLDADTHEAFAERLEAALAVATEDEAAELRQGGVDLEAASLVDAFWGGGDQKEIGERAMAMLLADGLRPSDEALGLMSTVLINWGWFELEPDDILARADQLAEAWGDNEAMAQTVERLRKMAEDKRKQG